MILTCRSSSRSGGSSTFTSREYLYPGSNFSLINAFECRSAAVIGGDMNSQAELSDQTFPAVGAGVGFGLEPLRSRTLVLSVGRFVCGQTGCGRVLRQVPTPEDQSHRHMP